MSNKYQIQKAYDKLRRAKDKDILSLVGQTDWKIVNDVIMNRAMFVAPSGEIIAAKSSKGTHDRFPEDLILYVSGLPENEEPTDPFYFEQVTYDLLRDLTRLKGWIRLNGGSNAVEERCYAVLTDWNEGRPTNTQLYVLEDFINMAYDNNREYVIIFFGEGGIDSKTFYFNQYMPEDIMRIVKRYYTSGRIYEGLKEGVWKRKTYTTIDWRGNQVVKEYDEYAPQSDSKYRRLCSKPINTLTLDEIVYIFAIHWCIYMSESQYSVEEALEYAQSKHSSDLQKCYDFVHSLKFPLTIYRAIRESERGFNIGGKKNSRSWTTNINIYKDEKSAFKNATDIIAGEIEPDIIDVANTISNFVHYTARPSYGRFGEYEITLKGNFKSNDIMNLRTINKDDIYEGLKKKRLKEVYPNKGENKKDFISRFMSVTKKEYPDIKQRLAVANAYWDRRDKVNEAYEEPPTDYGTGEVVGKDIFDRKTYVPFYDRILRHPEEAAEEENLKAEIVMMSPEEYYKECATKIFRNTTVDSLKEQRRWSEKTLEYLTKLVTQYKRKMFMPYINYAERGQEGLHRMMVAGDLFGWDEKFPVLAITTYDEERKRREDKAEEEYKINRMFNLAVGKYRWHQYENEESLEEDIRDYIADYYSPDSFEFYDPFTFIMWYSKNDEEYSGYDTCLVFAVANKGEDEVGENNFSVEVDAKGITFWDEEEEADTDTDDDGLNFDEVDWDSPYWDGVDLNDPNLDIDALLKKARKSTP